MLTSEDSMIEILEDNYGNEYEETYHAAEHFGCSQTNILLIGLIKEMKELNRLVYNKWEARE